MSLKDILGDAERDANYFVESAKSVALASGGPNPLGMVGGSAVAAVSGSQINHHAEQYRHYTGWTYSIIRIIAQRIAGQPVKMARKTSKANKAGALTTKRGRTRGIHAGRGMCPSVKHSLPKHLKTMSDDLEIIDDHHFLEALANPNAVMVQWALMFVTVASMELTGKAYWWFFVNEEGRLEIWPLPASWVEAVHTEDQLYEEWLVRPDGMSVAIRVPGEQIALIGYPDPSNPLNQVSPLQANARAVVADEAIQEAQRRAFLNGINPGYALIVARNPDAQGAPGARPQLDKTQRQQIITAVKQQYRGVVNFDEPLILDGLIEDVKKITMGPREMDFLNSSALSKERLTQGWGVNPVSMGQLEGANRASSATADDHLCGNVINPKIVLMSQVLTACVRVLYNDPDLVCYVEEAHAVDPDYELSVEQAMVGAGAMGNNEWRARHHMPPVKDGDIAIVGGMVFDVVREDQDEGGSKDSKSVTCWASEMGEKGYKRMWAKTHQANERAMVRGIRDVITGIGDEVKSHILSLSMRGEVGPEALSMLDTSHWENGIKEVSETHLLRSAFEGAAVEWELFIPRRSSGEIAWKSVPSVIGGTPIPREVEAKIKDWLKGILEQPYWTDIAENIRSDIAGAIRRGIEHGESGAEIADKIGRMMGGNAATQRSYLIARTEVTGALNAGHAATRERLAEGGLVKGKKWLCISDGDTRHEHRAASGQEVGNEEDFEVGGESCRYPGDVTLSASQRCNCRCTTITITTLD